MNELLEIAYNHENEFDSREFDCLIALIENGDIASIEELNKYL
jgi:hypothetical protein